MQPTGPTPPLAVRRAFGAVGEPSRLAGGFGGAWRCGDLVLKRSDAATDALACEARVLGSVADNDFRLQRLRRAADNSLLVDGWIARDYLEGEHEPHRWGDILGVGDALHAALAAVTREEAALMVDGRTDPWGVADRIAWDEHPMPNDAPLRPDPLPRLLAARRPVAARSQLVHGDLSGNVLFAEGRPPGIIDFSPYFRPPEWALAVIAADCVMWFGAGLDLLGLLAPRPEFGQCLIRAIIFRHVTGLLLKRGVPQGEAAVRYRSLVDVALTLAETA